MARTYECEVCGANRIPIPKEGSLDVPQLAIRIDPQILQEYAHKQESAKNWTGDLCVECSKRFLELMTDATAFVRWLRVACCKQAAPMPASPNLNIASIPKTPSGVNDAGNPEAKNIVPPYMQDGQILTPKSMVPVRAKQKIGGNLDDKF